MMRSIRFYGLGFIMSLAGLALVFTGMLPLPAAAEEVREVNIYSAQKAHLIQPLLDRFTAQTGIATNLITGKAPALITRMESEGRHSPADVFLAADVSNLYRADDVKHLLQPLASELLEARVPPHLRDPDGHWYGLTVRARALFYNKETVSPDRLSTYEALADPEWRGNILIRSSSNAYNQSLLASLIAHNGKEAARDWAKGMVANFARTPSGGDTDQLRALAAGEGVVAIANTYYYGRLQNAEDPHDRELAGKIGIFFPNQQGRGTHINIRGGGIAAHAPHPENARALLEFLVSDAAQQVFAEINHEYPVVEGIAWPETLRAWGEFTRDTLSLETIGELNGTALTLFDEANWP